MLGMFLRGKGGGANFINMINLVIVRAKPHAITFFTTGSLCPAWSRIDHLAYESSNFKDFIPKLMDYHFSIIKYAFPISNRFKFWTGLKISFNNSIRRRFSL